MYRDIQFEKIAKKHHFSYSYNDEFGLINLLRDFRLFSKLSSKKITNILGEKSELQESKFYIFIYADCFFCPIKKISFALLFYGTSRLLY